MKKFFFWQPRVYPSLPPQVLVISNYLIWLFLFYISFILIKANTNIFWQILVATILSEFIEKLLKIKNLWQRPIVNKKGNIPNGLIKNWYTNGSFPSGHAMKAVFFLLFIIQYGGFSTGNYLLIVVPLVVFRVFIGFHYPLDVIGGIFFGFFCWLISHVIIAPSFLNNFIRVIFNYVFRL